MIRPVILIALTLSFTAVDGAEFDHAHAIFGRVLEKNAKNGLVNYRALKTDPRDLDSYLAALDAVEERDFKQWAEASQLAFLINLYNASVLKLIVDHYPVKSIRKIGGWFGQPWDVEVVPYFGSIATLGYLEHEILRKNYREPRIHFALVCAALGCPGLRPEPFIPEALDRQLDEQGRKFLGDPRKNRLDVKTRTAHLSPIFKWFAADFERQSGSVLKFIRPCFAPEIQSALAQGNWKVRYTDYDWSLNDLSAAR